MSTKTNNRGPKRFYWDLVLNNYTEKDCEAVHDIFEKVGKEYLVAEEIGSKMNTPHLQMFISLMKGNYKSYLLNLFKSTCVGDRISIREVRNIDAIRSYVVKDGKVLFEKKLTEKKKKSILELILEGKQPEDWQEMIKGDDWMKCKKCKVSLTELRCNCQMNI